MTARQLPPAAVGTRHNPTGCHFRPRTHWYQIDGYWHSVRCRHHLGLPLLYLATRPPIHSSVYRIVELLNFLFYFFQIRRTGCKSHAHAFTSPEQPTRSVGTTKPLQQGKPSPAARSTTHHRRGSWASGRTIRTPVHVNRGKGRARIPLFFF